ncbi:MAG TPA: RT0821/Lpp0805 family surface protein [Stellaceae bacterium]|nr:RT0821/Lpp0805 family surface protein [Stellaceae bacterium]
MNNRLSVIAVVSVILCGLNGGRAAAQWFGPTWDPNIELTSQDRAMMRNTVQREIHGRRLDTVARWTNPASGHSGTITLLSKSVRRAMPCEQIEYRIMSSKPGEQSERYVFHSCRLPDGTWKLAD